MIHDREITISVGNSRKSMVWVAQKIKVSALYDRMKQVVRGKETVAEFFRMQKSQQDDLKDVAGGFVGGTLNGPRRKVQNVKSRSIITLDFDTIKALMTDTIIGKLDLCGFSYCVYSTRKHVPNAPRLRVLVPTDRDMTVDEYEPCARRVAEYIGIEQADPTTFELHRLFYYPTACADAEFVYRMKDAPFVKVDDLLKTYQDWHNVTEWPQVPGSFNYTKLATKQGDPEGKNGIVGAFCRVYDVYRAMNELIPGIYAPVDNAENRFTYLNGSTAGGAVVYEDGKFLYSHHATDPCSGRLVNAFDLVRLHKFGDQDEDCDPGLPANRLPSYKKMCEFANGLEDVAALILKERFQSTIDDFKNLPGVGMDTSLASAAGVAATDARATQAGGAAAADAGDGTGSADPTTDFNWMLKLERDRNNKILNSINNVLIIMENDPNLAGRFALNEFSGRGEVLAALPWAKEYKGRRMWSDTDSNGLYWYLEKAYLITGRGNIDSALDIHASVHAFNDVTKFLDGLQWDGKPRLDTLFIDYLGAEDSPYTRAVCRKTFCGAIARAYKPGCKFDTMLILCGPQGIGKSTIIDKMSKGWYNDSIRTFEGKDASELLQGVWLVEVAELDAFRRTDVACIKQFLSLRADRYRAAYGRNVKEYPRRCVFFGTCNQMEFLQDTTGNRRFWPVDVGVDVEQTKGVALPPHASAHRLSVFKDLTDDVVAQVWAEAKIRYQMGEELYLTGDLEETARKQQEEHRESAAQEGLIIDFLNKKVPSDWANWPVNKRRDYWAGAVKTDGLNLVKRDRVCAIEVWTECFLKASADIKKQDTALINSIISRQKGWKRASIRVLPYGGSSPMKGFIRTG